MWWRARPRPSRFVAVFVIHFCDANSLMMQEVFEAERRCNAIEDETRRIQLTAAELLRACHDEKACAAFELCFAVFLLQH